MTLNITESPKSDISTVLAYYVTPGTHANGSPKFCDTWTDFNSDYKPGTAREFIAEIEAKNPGKYSRYHISWSNCN